MEHNMTQYEFPFTRIGQLQAYNAKQLGHMDRLYRNFLTASSLESTPQRKKAWEIMYVDSGMASNFSDKYRDMFNTKPVESINDKVLMCWERNQPFKDLSHLL